MKLFFETLEDYYTVAPPVAGEPGHIEAHEHINYLIKYPIEVGSYYTLQKINESEWSVDIEGSGTETAPEDLIYQLLDAPPELPAGNQIGIWVGAEYSTQYPVGTELTMYGMATIMYLGFELNRFKDQIATLTNRINTLEENN